MAKNFVSHSINYEDVILRRIFANQMTGFFVDVGAAHPIDDNDTHLLSQSGWKGINAEPNPVFFRQLEAERPNDYNFEVAISDQEGTLDWFQVGDTGLSTCDSAEAMRAAAKGYVVTRHTVPTTTLACILNDVSPETIDLLKVDVEGLELDVLRGNDWHRWRPKVIIVEATLPESSERRPDRVRPFLVDLGYRHVHFDGLNDWFVEAIFEPPAGVFLPPNVFDSFVTRRQAILEQEVKHLTELTKRSQSYAASLEESTVALKDNAESSTNAYHHLQQELYSANAVLADVYRRERRLQADLVDRERDVMRSRAMASEAHSLYASIGVDLEAALQTIANNASEVANLQVSLAVLRRESEEAEQLRHELVCKTEATEVLLRQRRSSTVELVRLQQNNTALSEQLSLNVRLLRCAEDRSHQLEFSTTWRATQPLRSMVSVLRHLIGV